MHTTQQLCREVQRRNKFTSAYKLAQLMDVSRTTACNWVNKTSVFSTSNAVKCARLLTLPDVYVVACVNYEKEKDPEAKQFWKALADNIPEENSDNLAA